MTQVTASAPGKFVILGEHAVVYGKPAIALAIDRRFTVRVSPGPEFRINGEPADINANPHIKHVSSLYDMRPVSLYTESRIPPGAGLGSSAALSVAFSGAMRRLHGLAVEPESVAAEAFDAEYAAQGRGSPMDTSACTHGYGVALNMRGCDRPLWSLEKGGNRWDVHDIDVPAMTFVIGHTGIRAATGPLVEKVRKFRERNRFASDIVDEIGDVTLEGMTALRTDDRVRLGELMTYDHKLLSILGVSCKELNKLVDASLPHAYGAKLTGSGGGGCMIALTDAPDRVAEAIRSRGGMPYTVSTRVEGLTVGR